MAKASDVVARARRTLQDYDADRNSDADLERLLNGARRALSVAKPDTYSIEANLVMVAGSRQSLPTDCNYFYDMPRTLAGQPITVVEREYLDALLPSWRTGTAGSTQHFCFDERDPSALDVYPPAANGDTNKIIYSRRPDDIDLSTDLLPREALHLDALADYVIGRALLEDAESPANERRGMQHLSLCGSAWNSDLSALLSFSPNTANVGGRLPKSTTGR